jgi:hypothetical protein
MSMTPNNSTSVLCWPKKVLSADDLRRHLTSQRELLLLPRTVITPLALDELRAKGIRVQWQASPGMNDAIPGGPSAKWYYAQETPDTMISLVMHALEREGVQVAYIAPGLPWVSAIASYAEMLVSNKSGGIAFVREPSLVCCIANKIAGIRAASVHSVPSIAATKKALGPNLFALDQSGKTFFELRQMLRTITADAPKCGDDIAKTLSELDGHAHR